MTLKGETELHRITAELWPRVPRDCSSKKTLCKSQQLLAGFHIELFSPVAYTLWHTYSILCPDGQYREFVDKNSRKILHLPVWKMPFMQCLCCLPHRTSFLLMKAPELGTKKTNQPTKTSPKMGLLGFIMSWSESHISQKTSNCITKSLHVNWLYTWKGYDFHYQSEWVDRLIFQLLKPAEAHPFPHTKSPTFTYMQENHPDQSDSKRRAIYTLTLNNFIGINLYNFSSTH